MRKWFIGDFMPKEVSQKIIRIEEEEIMNQFHHDLEIMYIDKQYIDEHHFKTDLKKEFLYMYGPGVHFNWMAWRKKEMYSSKINLTYFEFLDLIREQDYYIKDGATATFTGKIKKRKAIVLKIDKLPESFNHILEDHGFEIDDVTGEPTLLF